MKRHFSIKYNKHIVTIYPGDIYATSDDEMIATLLGSCIAVCLFDTESEVSAMNHFMLDGKVLGNSLKTETSEKHAFHSIYRLIDLAVSKGAVRSKLLAKVFGGGAVLKSEQSYHDVPSSNISAAKMVLEMEDIPIIQQDTGGKYTRKILLDSKSGKVFLKRSLGANLDN